MREDLEGVRKHRVKRSVFIHFSKVGSNWNACLPCNILLKSNCVESELVPGNIICKASRGCELGFSVRTRTLDCFVVMRLISEELL